MTMHASRPKQFWPIDAMRLSLRIVSLLILVAWLSPSTFAQDSKKQSKLEQFGAVRGRAPDGWAQFDWPKKRAVLFGQFAPTAEEKELIIQALPKSPIASVTKPRKVLVFYRCQYPHASIATGNFAFEKLGTATGAYEATLTDDPTAINLKNLQQYDALLLNNTTDFDVTVGEPGRQAILDFVKSGKGLIGIHAAADSCKSWEEGARLFNGIFAGHPWLPKGTWAFKLDAPAHPLNQMFPSAEFDARDEIYIYRAGSHDRQASKILVELDLDQTQNHESPELNQKIKDLTRAESHRPVAWIHEFGEETPRGRVFYSNFGHNNTTFWNPLILKHYLAGIQYATGDLTADATPSNP